VRVVETELPGVLIIEPDVHSDPRGFFVETYHSEKYGPTASSVRSSRTTTRAPPAARCAASTSNCVGRKENWYG
jgi:hypothetical protein